MSKRARRTTKRERKAAARGGSPVVSGRDRFGRKYLIVTDEAASFDEVFAPESADGSSNDRPATP